jgi:hypothetical protein
VLGRALAVVAVGLIAAACSGGGDDAGPPAPATTGAVPLLSEGSFEQVVAAEIAGAGVAAEPAGNLTVRADQGLNSVVTDLSSAYGEYEAEPSRRGVIVVAAADMTRDRLVRGLAGEEYDAVKGSLMPLLEPAFALRGLPVEPATKSFVSDLSLAYVADRESGRLVVTADDLERWGIPLDELDRVAQANLVRRTEPLLCEEELCGWASGDGYDATRMTSPRLRRDIAREIGRAVYAVPREDVFVALPVRYASRIRQKVLQQFTQAENPVSSEIFVEKAGRIVEYPPR